MTRMLVSFILLGSLSACGPRLAAQAEMPRSAKNAVQSWADAYNSDQIDTLAQLVHPRRTAAFKRGRSALIEQLKVWRIDRYRMGHKVRVNNELNGREVSLDLHDGRRGKQVTGVVVETKGRWWLWTY